MERSGPLTVGSQREKLRKQLRARTITPDIVAQYQPPPLVVRQQTVVKPRGQTFPFRGQKVNITQILNQHPEIKQNLIQRGVKSPLAQRNRLRKELLAGRDPMVIQPRRQTLIINGNRFTARQALERYPQLREFLQPKRRLTEKSLLAKVRKYINGNKVPDHILNLQPPEFHMIQGALDQTFRNYLDDPRIRNHDVPFLFTYIHNSIIRLMQQNLNTKVYLNLRANKAKVNKDYKEEVHTFYSGGFEIFPGTNLDEVLSQMKSNVIERLAKLQNAVGSSWTLIGLVDVKMHFADYQPLAGSSYVKLPKVLLLTWRTRATTSALSGL